MDLEKIKEKLNNYYLVYEALVDLASSAEDPFVKSRLNSIALRLSKMHGRTRKLGNIDVFRKSIICSS